MNILINLNNNFIIVKSCRQKSVENTFNMLDRGPFHSLHAR